TQTGILRNTGVCEYNVQPAFLPLDLGKKAIKIIKLRDVALHAGYISVDFLHRSSQLWFAPAGDEHVRALIHKPLRRSKTNPASASGYESNFSFEFAHVYFSIQAESLCRMLSMVAALMQSSWTPHHVQMRVRGARPHDVRAGISVNGWQAGGLWVKRPHDHPMWTDSDWRTGFVVWIGIAALSSTREHVSASPDCVGWLCVMRYKISGHHCIDGPSAHIGGSPMTFGMPGMQVKPLDPSRKTTVCPWASLSMIFADWAISAGPADMARSIFVSVVSLVS